MSDSGNDSVELGALEPVLDADRPIIDPHHHLWAPGQSAGYALEDLTADVRSGHRIVGTVFIECGASHRQDGPEPMRVVGETEFVAATAEQAKAAGAAPIQGIVGAANLRDPGVADVLAGHVEAGRGLFRGVRHAAAWDASEAIRPSHHHPPPELYLDAAFREGFSRLAPAGLTFDAWLFHPQIPDLTDLARAFPETPIVLDHFGGPLGIGPYANDREGVFQSWRRDIAPLAACPNVFIKLGGMAMPINGYGWHKPPGVSPSSEAFVAAQGDYYRVAIDLFGPSRSMFESNFPVDRASLSYRVLFNAFKRIAELYDAAEKDALFRGAAADFYRLST